MREFPRAMLPAVDVRCDRCHTEYEFDDSKVSDAGVTVKCTHCGHLFRVRRTQSPPAPGADRPWMLHSAGTGDVSRFTDFPTLEQWIRQGRARRGDAISRSGDVWRRLGEIPELVPLFEQVERASPAAKSRPSQPPSRRTQPPMDGRRPTSPPTQANPRKSQTPVPPSFSESSEDSGPYSIGDLGAATASEPRFTGVLTPQVPGEPSGSEAREGLSESDFTLPRNQSRVWFAVTGASLAALLVLAAFAYRDRIFGSASGKPAVESGHDPAYKHAFEAIARDTDASLEEADRVLQDQASKPKDNATALAALAELYTIWSFALQLEAATLEDLAKLGTPAPKIRAEERRRQSQKRLGEAKLSVSLAQGQAPASPFAARATALYLILTEGARTEVENHLKRAGTGPETDFVQAALLRREGDREGAKKILQAMALEPSGRAPVRAIYLLAHIEHELGHNDAAKPWLERILAGHADHERARVLRDLITQPLPDAEVVATNKEPVEATPEQLVAQGNKHLEYGRTAQAKRLFERALGLKPGYARALTGLGFADLDGHEYESSLATFRKALGAGDKEALFGIAEAHKGQGDSAKAAEYYRRFLNEGGKGENAQVAKRSLEMLSRAAGDDESEKPQLKPEARLPPPDDKGEPKPEE